LQEAMRQADVWTQRAQASFGTQNWVQADGEFEQVRHQVSKRCSKQLACFQQHTAVCFLIVPWHVPTQPREDSVECVMYTLHRFG
jgi:hypothetical protein